MHTGGVWRIGRIHYHFLGDVKIPEESDENIWTNQIVLNCRDMTSTYLISEHRYHVT